MRYDYERTNLVEVVLLAASSNVSLGCRHDDVWFECWLFCGLGVLFSKEAAHVMLSVYKGCFAVRNLF
jgi:hypothetical protein